MRFELKRTLPNEFDEFFQTLVKNDRYASIEEAGIRLRQTQEALRLEIASGIRQLDAGESFGEDEVSAGVESPIFKRSV